MLNSEEQKDQSRSQKEPSNSKEPVKEQPTRGTKEIGAILVSKLLANDDAPANDKPKEEVADEKEKEEETESEPTTPSRNAPRAFERSNNLYENFPEQNHVDDEIEFFWWHAPEIDFEMEEIPNCEGYSL